MQEQLDFLKITHAHNRKSINGVLSSIEFENDGYYIVYLPSIKVSSYGKTQEEAAKMMSEIVIPDFCETLMAQKSDKVYADLAILGFKRKGFFRSELSQTAHVDTQGILREFDLSADTKVTKNLVTV